MRPVTSLLLFAALFSTPLWAVHPDKSSTVPPIGQTENPFLGSWAFELPDGNPAWLRVQEQEDTLTAQLLWSVGSARPATDVRIDGNTLLFKRKLRWKPYGESVTKVITKEIRGNLKAKQLVLTVQQVDAETDKRETLTLVGKKMPPLPPRPDTGKLVFGKPLKLFDGKSLVGWRLSNPKKQNGWRAENGVLINETPKTTFTAYGSYGNLRTVATFSDFELSIEYNVPEKGNSGIYLRGMYEAQVVDRDSRMQGISGPGAVFGRILPTENAGNPGGQWNRYRLLLVDRHITVELNGKTVIANQPLLGCTGGGISADDTAPGPILLQGDHTSVRYRNIVLRPVVKK